MACILHVSVKYIAGLLWESCAAARVYHGWWVMRTGRPRTITPAHYYPYGSKRMQDAARREAARQVSAALHAGVLVRRPCERCGRRKGVDGHHEDYSRPLDVTWLCKVHHSRRHWELRQQAKAILGPTGMKPPKPTPQPPVTAIPESLAIRIYRQIASNPALCYGPIRDATMAVAEAIDREGISHNALAKKLGCSRQHVSAMFGSGLRTLKSLITVADAVGYEVKVSLVKKEKAA